MNVVAGSKITEIGAKYINPNTHTVVPGKVYHTEFTVGGLRTVFPGWENEFISNLRADMASEGHRVEYIEIRDKYITVQWTAYPSLTGTNFQPQVAPIVVYAVILGIIAIIALYFIVEGLRETKELVNTVGDSSEKTALSMGALVVGALVLVLLLR